MTVVVIMTVVVKTALLPRLLHFSIEHSADRKIFLFLFDLFNFKRNAKPLRKVSFRNSQIASDGSDGVEVLMEPEERRRYLGAGFPIHLYCFVVFQVALTCCSPDSLSTARPRRRSPSNDGCAR